MLNAGFIAIGVKVETEIGSHTVQRYVLARIGIEGHAAHPVQELAEGRVAG